MKFYCREHSKLHSSKDAKHAKCYETYQADCCEPSTPSCQQSAPSCPDGPSFSESCPSGPSCPSDPPTCGQSSGSCDHCDSDSSSDSDSGFGSNSFSDNTMNNFAMKKGKSPKGIKAQRKPKKPKKKTGSAAALVHDFACERSGGHKDCNCEKRRMCLVDQGKYIAPCDQWKLNVQLYKPECFVPKWKCGYFKSCEDCFIVSVVSAAGAPWEAYTTSGTVFALNGVQNRTLRLCRGKQYYFSVPSVTTTPTICTDDLVIQITQKNPAPVNMDQNLLIFTASPTGGSGASSVINTPTLSLPNTDPDTRTVRLDTTHLPSILYYQNQYSSFMGGIIIIEDCHKPKKAC